MSDPRAPGADLRDPAALAALEAVGLRRVEVLDEVGSTNDHLAAAARPAGGTDPAAAWPDLSLVAAGHQSAGRGRLDRVWTTEPGTALTFSLLLRPAGAVPLPDYPWLTLLMAVSVAEALAAEGVDAAVKWPNDVLVDGRKIAGLLAVLVPGDPPAVVLGAGVNVGQDALPVPTATSLRRLTGRASPRPQLLVRVLEAFLPRYRRLCAEPGAAAPGGALHAQVAGRMETLGRAVRAELPGGRPPLVGTAEGLGASGALLVRDAAGTVHEVTAGDVVHLRPAAPAAAAPGASDGGAGDRP
ncbi:hypothetical protein AS188_08030 [Kocuria flava]|uniref:biotin--[biotin carboxyl-carrier protein] ligase n=1 Tax=Kocuria flava TaxID=446860 RepID=A0A0U2NZ65_9MICC|nr:biotin--[acetyl-CoA-carboxylase] ligase [Kocuria flava]ALU39709.1 hypothetical protein AS188_08030 [Kocuria flava]GEO91693.1 biotin--[acetyl-CoA-carboxylase] ligase [Kocuria flava]